MSKIKESVNNCGAPSVLMCNLDVEIARQDVRATGTGSTYEIARANAYRDLAEQLVDALTPDAK